MTVTVIGRAARVQGRVSGEGDVEILGFIEGDVAVDGDVTVDSQGLVGGAVRGRRILVRGAVRGDLVGEQAIALEDGARVVGDLRAPRVVIAEGALVRGQVQTEGEAAAAPGLRAHGAARAAGTSTARAVPMPARAASPAAAAAMRPLAKPEVATAASSSSPLHGSVATTARRPPPPVVPALKKVKGQLVKKKER